MTNTNASSPRKKMKFAQKFHEYEDEEEKVDAENALVRNNPLENIQEERQPVKDIQVSQVVGGTVKTLNTSSLPEKLVKVLYQKDVKKELQLLKNNLG